MRAFSMRYRNARLAAALLALAVVSAAGCADPGPEAVIDQGIFSRQATSVTGESVDLASLANQDLVVWFWAPW